MYTGAILCLTRWFKTFGKSVINKFMLLLNSIQSRKSKNLIFASCIPYAHSVQTSLFQCTLSQIVGSRKENRIDGQTQLGLNATHTSNKNICYKNDCAPNIFKFRQMLQHQFIGNPRQIQAPCIQISLIDTSTIKNFKTP